MDMADDTSITSPAGGSEEVNGASNHSPCHSKVDTNNRSPVEMNLEIKKEIVSDEADETSEHSFVLKSLVCPICKQDCGGQSEWDEHIVKHGLPLRCFYCQDVLPNASALGKHRSECSRKASLRGCSHCGKTFTNLETLLTHEYLVHQPSLEPRAISREKTISHEKRQQTMYTCSVCYEKHDSFESMQSHLGDHLESLGSNGKELECRICSVVFVSRAALSTHISSPRHREKIMRIKNLFKCNHCGIVFPSRDGYAMHMLDIAREDSENDVTIQTIGLFASMDPTGPQELQSVSEMTTGMESKTVSAREESSAGSVNSDNEPKVPSVVIKQEPIDPDYETSETAESCDGGSSTLDGIRIKGKRGVNNNMLHNLMSDGYKCGLCGKRLEDQDSFAMHMMHHARAMEEHSQKQRILGKVPEQPLDLRPVKLEPGEGSGPSEVSYAPAVGIACPHCMVLFVTRDALAMHMMEEHADKAYSHKSKLTRLIRMGLQETPTQVQSTRISYPCQVCGRSFRDQDTLAMHMLMHSQSELLLLAQKPSSTINLSELSGSPRSTHSGTSPSQSEDWQRSVLNALYKDLPGITSGMLKSNQAEADVGQSHTEGASTRSRGSASEACHMVSSNMESHGDDRLRSSSLETFIPDNQIHEEFYAGQYDRSVITYDKEGQKWNCTACCVEFRSLISVTRHIGHVSHKLEMEKRLRDIMASGKSLWQATGDSNSQSELIGVLCRRCGKQFENRMELNVHTALLCRGGSHHRLGEHLMNGKRLREEDLDNSVIRPRSTQSCHERSVTGVDLVRKRRCSEDLDLVCHDRITKRHRQLSPIRQNSEETARILAENRKAYISNLAWNLNNSRPGTQFHRPASVDSSVSHRQGTSPRVLPSGVSEADSNTDIDNDSSNTDVMDFILKQKELFMCKFCKIIFTDKTVYYLHMGLHNLNNPWQCNLCGKPCSDVHEFSSHVIHF